ncbi:hypothetical protein D3C80_1182990 [compost metagenome]
MPCPDIESPDAVAGMQTPNAGKPVFTGLPALPATLHPARKHDETARLQGCTALPESISLWTQSHTPVVGRSVSQSDSSRSAGGIGLLMDHLHLEMVAR